MEFGSIVLSCSALFECVPIFSNLPLFLTIFCVRKLVFKCDFLGVSHWKNIWQKREMEDVNVDISKVRSVSFSSKIFHIVALFSNVTHTANSDDSFLNCSVLADALCEHVLCFSVSGGVEQLVQSWLWSDSLLQQHLSLRLPLLSRVRARLPLTAKKTFYSTFAL